MEKNSEKIVFEDEWLEISVAESKPKTKVFSVWSKSSACVLGVVHWRNTWRKYTFSPIVKFETDFSDRCLFALAEFVYQQNREHIANRRLR